MHLVVDMVMHHCPIPAGFLAITFDKYEIFQCALFNGILHEDNTLNDIKHDGIIIQKYLKF